MSVIISETQKAQKIFQPKPFCAFCGVTILKAKKAKSEFTAITI